VHEGELDDLFRFYLDFTFFGFRILELRSEANLLNVYCFSMTN
jgi:hypothetical protein